MDHSHRIPVNSSLEHSSLSIDYCGINMTAMRAHWHTAGNINVTTPVIMFIAGILGNTLALVILYRIRTETRFLMFHTLVAGLAWTDITGQILTSPVIIYTYINKLEWVGGVTLCRFNGFVMVCFGLSTPMIVSVMAVERCVSLKFPYFFSRHCNQMTGRWTLVSIWFFVLIYSMLPLFGAGQYSLQYPGTYCFCTFHTGKFLHGLYSGTYAFLNLIVMFTMTVCNLYVVGTLIVVRHMWRTASGHFLPQCPVTVPVDPLNKQRGITQPMDTPNRHMNMSQTMDQSKSADQQRSDDWQMVILLCVMTLAFLICWLPLMVLILVTIFTGVPYCTLNLLAIRMASVNQILDPWFYIIIRKTLISRFISFWKRLISWGQSVSSCSYYRGAEIPWGRPHIVQPVSNRHMYVVKPCNIDGIKDGIKVDVVRDAKYADALRDAKYADAIREAKYAEAVREVMQFDARPALEGARYRDKDVGNASTPECRSRLRLADDDHHTTPPEKTCRMRLIENKVPYYDPGQDIESIDNVSNAGSNDFVVIFANAHPLSEDADDIHASSSGYCDFDDIGSASGNPQTKHTNASESSDRRTSVDRRSDSKTQPGSDTRTLGSEPRSSTGSGMRTPRSDKTTTSGDTRMLNDSGNNAPIITVSDNIDIQTDRPNSGQICDNSLFDVDDQHLNLISNMEKPPCQRSASLNMQSNNPKHTIRDTGSYTEIPHVKSKSKNSKDKPKKQSSGKFRWSLKSRSSGKARSAPPAVEPLLKDGSEMLTETSGFCTGESDKKSERSRYHSCEPASSLAPADNMCVSAI